MPLDSNLTGDELIFHRARTWLLVFGIWTIPAVLTTTMMTLRMGDNPGFSFLLTMGSQLMVWYPWALATPLFFRLGGRFSIGPGRRIKHLFIHLVLGIFFALIFQAYLLAAELIFYEEARQALTWAAMTDYWARTLPQLPVQALFYWLILSAGFAWRYYRSNRERDHLLVQARLQALQAQIHPHFLFNTLHAVSTLMDEDIQAARAMIVRLSELLRARLSNETRTVVPLSEELTVLRHYLDIERIRFQDRLRVEIHADARVLDIPVPPLLLQPLAENAIRHGIAKSSRAERVEIRAELVGDKLEITITDDGPGFKTVTEGVGLSNTRKRLMHLFGDAACLTIVNRESGGCRVTLCLPIRKDGAHDRK